MEVRSCYLALTSERQDRERTPRELIRPMLIHCISYTVTQPGEEGNHLHARTQYDGSDGSSGNIRNKVFTRMSVLRSHAYAGFVLVVFLVDVPVGQAVVVNAVEGEGPDVLRTHTEQNLPDYFPNWGDSRTSGEVETS